MGGSGPGNFEENCLDGKDNDFDELVDCDDPDCKEACNDPCLKPGQIQLGSTPSKVTINGIWKGHADVFQPDCSTTASTGPDVAYSIENTSGQDAFLRVVATSASGNVVLSRRQSCKPGSQDVPCQDKLGVGGSEELTQFVASGDSVVVIVGASEPQATDVFTMEAELILPKCGDGVVTPDEACDDPQDPGCNACKITACEDASPIKDGETIFAKQADAKVSSSLEPSCSKLGSKSSERIHSFRAAQSGWLQAVLRSQGEADLTLSLWSSCGAGNEVACADTAPGGAGTLERLVRPVAAGELVYLVVDSYDGSAVTDYELFARTFPAECGDGQPSPTEQCDGDENCEGDCTRKLEALDEVEPNENISQATASKPEAFLQKKAALRGKIQQSGDRDVFAIKVEQGGVLEIATNDPGDKSCKREGFSESPVGVLDSSLRLLSSAGQVLASSDNSAADGFCSRISAKVTPGTYLVEVRASEAAPAQVFSYLLEVTLPLSRSPMTPSARVLFGSFLLAGVIACGADDASLDTGAFRCEGGASNCSPTSGSAGSGGSSEKGAGGGSGAVQNSAGAGGSDNAFGGSSTAGSSSAGTSGGSLSDPPLPPEGPCSECAAKSCKDLPSCECAASECETECEAFYEDSCSSDGNGGVGQGGGAGGSGGEGGTSGVAEFDCSNGLDDNENDAADCDDQNCSAACSELCSQPMTLALGEIRQGSLLGHSSTFQANCLIGAPGVSVAYRIDIPGDGWLSLKLSSAGNMALSTHKSDCIGSGYSHCRNDAGVGGDEALTVEVKKGEPWYVVATAVEASDIGTFSLLANFEASVCGDGKLSLDEKCDDGNTDDGDGCSADCKIDTCDSAPALEDVLISTKDGAPPPVVVTGTLAGGKSLLQASCSKLGTTTVERVHAFRAANPGRLEVSVLPKTPGEDLILSVRSSCDPGGELVCSDAGSVGGAERLSLPAQAGQPFYFVVEGSAAGMEGDYELRAQTLPVSCGDGLLVKSVEQCDPKADEKKCAAGCTRLPEDGDSTGSSAVAGFPAGGVALGRIFPAGDADRFAIEVPVGKKARLSVLDPTTAPDCADGRLDSQLEVFDASGLLVAFNDDKDGAAGYCSELELKMPGKYTVQVRSSQRSAPVQVFSYKLAATFF